jgi:hypothetical protein
MKILTGHTTPETAYVVGDYPYGYTLRCKIRYWLEHKAKHGFRLVSQTTNPKRPGEVWNKPKASTYTTFAVMYLDDEEHVHWSGINAAYSDAAELKAWAAKWGEGLPEGAVKALNAITNAKAAYEAARNPGDPLDVGLVEARKAFVDSSK